MPPMPWRKPVTAALFAGYTMAATSGLVMDGYLVKLNSHGDTLWTRTMAAPATKPSTLCGGTPEEGGYILSGYVLPTSSGNRDMWLVKTDSLGHVLWERTYDHGHDRDKATCLDYDGEGGYIVAGFTIPSANADLWLIRTGPDSVLLPVDDLSSILHPSSFILSAFPNPFNPTTKLRFDLPRAARVSLQVFDMQGRKVATLIDGFRPSGRHTITFDGSTLPSGLYFARIQSAANTQTQKLILLK